MMGLVVAVVVVSFVSVNKVGVVMRGWSSWCAATLVEVPLAK